MSKAIAAPLEFELGDYSEESYRNYSMYVILQRALPSICDGLKPVQRRIVFAMDQLRLDWRAKHKKSARTIGDVLGKYHPHGDSACYEAMVLMAQPFSYRYPLVDGQGNWGSPDDPKSFAAMRYTEARLTRYAQSLLDEVNEDNVDYRPNFDGSLKEPRVLPAQVPNILLNGASGIAVGMATDIPPHNICEVVEATRHLIDHPEASVRELMGFIKGPDFPGGAEIISSPEEILGAYEQGQGRVRVRARYAKQGNAIVIRALPHKVSGEVVIQQVAKLMEAKRLPMVDDIRDESDHREPTRIVIEMKRGGGMPKEVLFEHLCAKTDLEVSHRINFNMIGLDGRPGVKNLAEVLSEWIEFRRGTIIRRLRARAGKIDARLNIVDALLRVMMDIDEVIRIIRHDRDPRAALMAQFGLNETQADAVLDTRLRHLARLEQDRLDKERDSLNHEKEQIEKTLSSARRLNTLMKKELGEAMAIYDDGMRCPLCPAESARPIDENVMLPGEALTVLLSKDGWIRAAKGHDLRTEFSYRGNDGPLARVECEDKDMLCLLDDTGRIYNVRAGDLPSARGYGDAVTAHVKPPSGARMAALFKPDPAADYLMISDGGYGMIVPGEQVLTKNRKGKQVLNCPGCRPLPPIPLNGEHAELALVSEAGHLLIIALEQLPKLDKGKGRKLIRLGEGDRLSLAMPLALDDALEFNRGDRGGRWTPAQRRRWFGNPGAKGKKLRTHTS